MIVVEVAELSIVVVVIVLIVVVVIVVIVVLVIVVVVVVVVIVVIVVAVEVALLELTVAYYSTIGHQPLHSPPPPRSQAYSESVQSPSTAIRRTAPGTAGEKRADGGGAATNFSDLVNIAEISVRRVIDMAKKVCLLTRI